VFEEAAKGVLAPHGVQPWDGKSYFISQEDEGQCERLATINLLKVRTVHCYA
jgi:hypothetical protein